MDPQREQLIREQWDQSGGVAIDVEEILASPPAWCDVSGACASFFSRLDPSPLTKLEVLKENPKETAQRIEEVLSSMSRPCVSYLLTFLYEALRVDFTLYDILARIFHVYTILFRFLSRKDVEAADADRGAYVLSGILSHQDIVPINGVEALAVELVSGKLKGTQVGALAAIANLLKFDAYRVALWEDKKVVDFIFRVDAASPAPLLYKGLLCLWLWTFNKDLLSDMAGRGVVPIVNEVLAGSRVEKIVRLALQILKNSLGNAQMCEEVVEKGSLEIVQQLEYEKWRDSELYDDIKSCSAKISEEVITLSNAERYERELLSGKLAWGFIHTERFWVENVLKFEKDDFRAIRTLVGVLAQRSAPSQTLAVACHDLGEFARLHPIGKRICDRFAVKGRVLELMLDKDREVAREALLCVQKLMLQKHASLEA